MEDDLDLSQHFSPTYTVPEPSMTADAARDIDKLGMVGAASLDDKGYFTRIVTAQGMPVRRLMNPQNVRVLIVEDDENVGDLMEVVLHRHGLKTLRARNRKEIAEGLGGKPYPSLVLLDVMLEDINGFDVLNRIRQHPQLQHIPVLMVTSLGERKDVIRGLTLGANGYITKPVPPSALMQAVETVVAG